MFFIYKRFKGEMIKTNRAGALSTKAILPINKPCYYPFYMLYVDWNGDILYCSQNYLKNNLLGNFKNESLLSIWECDKLNLIRKNLINSKKK